MQKVSLLMLSLLIGGCSQPSPTPHLTGNDADAGFTQVANEYIAGYLAWRPQTGTALGLHQYDGKVTDYSQPSLDAELARLKSFDQRLAQLNTNRLGRRHFTTTAFSAAAFSGRFSDSSNCRFTRRTR